MMMCGQMDAFGLTMTRRKDQISRDAFLIADVAKSMRIRHSSLAIDDPSHLFGQTQGKLLLVADASGSYVSAANVSSIAVDQIAAYLLNTNRWFFRLEAADEDDFLEDLRAALLQCQQTLQQLSAVGSEKMVLGTTLTLVYIIWPRMYVLHVGDSRCYLYRNDKLQQLTRDHTVAERLATAGVSASGKEQGEAWSNMLWNVVGGDSEELTTDVHKVELRAGDTILLCTDGIHKSVAESSISKHLASQSSADAACRALISEARENSGPDDLTAVVASFGGTDSARQVETERIALTVDEAEPHTAVRHSDKQPLSSPDNPPPERRVLSFAGGDRLTPPAQH
jgi:serine/threonine protein phosphatase PrpC